MKAKILAAFQGFLIGTAILCALYIAYTANQGRQAKNEAKKLQQTYSENSRTQADWSGGMLAQNADYVGWLKVENTPIDTPVVQGEDNRYYLKHSFYKEENNHGCPFLDCNTDVTDSVLVIYGHNMKDDTMFGTLEKFQDDAFFHSQPKICWEDKQGQHFFQPFRVETISAAEPLNLSEFSSFQPAGKILLLVTCDYSRENSRLIQ